MIRNLLLITALAVCSITPVYASRCFRPSYVPQCQPVSAPACFATGTQALNNYISCRLCHDDIALHRVQVAVIPDKLRREIICTICHRDTRRIA